MNCAPGPGAQRRTGQLAANWLGCFGLVFLLAASGAPLAAATKPLGTWTCTVERKVTCTHGSCDVNKITKWTVVDFGAGRYSRCDKYGCSHSKMAFRQDGGYVHMTTLPPAGLMATMLPDGRRFVEVLTIDVSAVISYGRCQRGAS